MDADKINNLLEINLSAREELIKNLEKILEDKIDSIDVSLENIYFLQDVKKAIVTNLQEFKPGEEITMNRWSDYSCTKVGSKGRIVFQNDNEIMVDFYYQTGCNPPNASDRYKVDKGKAYKTKFYDLLAKYGDYQDAAKKIIEQAMEKIDLSDVQPIGIEKLIDKDEVYLVNDNSLLEEIKQDSIYFKKIRLKGTRKYLRGIGSVRIEAHPKFASNDCYTLHGKGIEKVLREKNEYLDYDSVKPAQTEASQELAELNIKEEAKKVNANYVLINQKHILLTEWHNTIISVIEGIPLMIIGKQEIENLLNKPSLEEDVIKAIKNFIPVKMIKSSYVGFAKLYPKEFITFFSSIESAEQKKLIIESLMKMDYDNKEVISWLDENESELIREVGLKLD